MNAWNHPIYDDAHALHAKHGLIDMHVDSIIQQRLFRYDVTKRHRPGRPAQPRFNHADFPRIREAGYSAMVMGIHYYPWESDKGWKEASKQISYLDKVVGEQPDMIRAYTAGDWIDAADAGKIAVAPGVEGSHILNGRIELVAEMATRGVVYLTLAHFSKNLAATPGLGRGANETDGLTSFGRELVRELNRFGIVIDTAHVNMPGVLDACAESRAPVFATHTGAKGVFDHARSLSDDAIDAIAASDGALAVIFSPGFLTGEKHGGISCVLDHMDYVAERVGAKHLCIGSDFDGWLPAIPDEMTDCRDIVKLTHGMLERGYTEEDIAGILYKNAQRVIRGAWDARDPNSRA